MEHNHDHGRLKQKLEVSDILKRAVRISFPNINFIIFILLTSLPLFGTMVFYELILQRTLVKASKILEPPYGYFYYSWPVPFYLQGRLSKDFCMDLIRLGILYIVPLHLLELFNVILTVDSASKLYTGETPIALRELVQKSIKARFKSPLITSIYVYYLSNSTICGLIWVVTQYYYISRNIFYGYFFVLIFAAAFIALLTKYLEWSAIWNMSIVISILEEEIRGLEAFALSDHFSRDNKGDGLLLMLVFFLWELGLRSICLYLGCFERVAGIIVPVILIFIGKVIKWVACMIYFFERKDCSLENVEDKVQEKAENVDGETMLSSLENVEDKVQGKAEEVDGETMLRETENSQIEIEQTKPEPGDATLQLV